jgi:hypothetical protein
VKQFRGLQNMAVLPIGYVILTGYIWVLLFVWAKLDPVYLPPVAFAGALWGMFWALPKKRK